MTKEKLIEFRNHYFPEKTGAKSRVLMCQEFKKHRLNVRCLMAWEYKQNPIPVWFVNVANDFDKDGVLKEKDNV